MNEYFLETKYIISGSKCDKLIRDGAILVENDKIVDVGKSKDIKKLISGHDKIEPNIGFNSEAVLKGDPGNTNDMVK